MKERPILFSGPMVRALRTGTKTQTRRVVKGVDECPHGYDAVKHVDGGKITLAGGDTVHCPYGERGDRLWVRENGWQRPERTPKMMREGADTWGPYYFDADGLTPADHEQFKAWGFKRRPSIHMPRKFCRLVLEVTGIRAERLQDIVEIDVRAEGCEVRAFWTFGADAVERRRIAADVYRNLWDSLNAKGGLGWRTNPWVWVVEFKRCATSTPS